MLCERCQNREANVHVTKIINGDKTEQHLCEQCAAETGELEMATSMFAPAFNWSGFLANILDPQVFALPTGGMNGLPDITCLNCGQTYENFRQMGQFGCSECYDTFSGNLDSLLNRIQGGATRHVGKIPGHAGQGLKQKQQLDRLRVDLRQAIQNEEYERAAELRDRIHALEKELEGGHQ